MQISEVKNAPTQYFLKLQLKKQTTTKYDYVKKMLQTFFDKHLHYKNILWC